MDRLFFTLGALFALLGVAAGAFGAHWLAARMPADLAAVYETAVRYQLVHALALLAVAWACTRWPGGSTYAAGWLFVIGILLFSGSLLVLSVTGLRSLGIVAPVGGTALLAGWACLAWSAWRPRGP
jgi:uncharacterized membrane protein YgdD (TMEM256/DUF423 family)